jgi:hypothetical protein
LSLGPVLALLLVTVLNLIAIAQPDKGYAIESKMVNSGETKMSDSSIASRLRNVIGPAPAPTPIRPRFQEQRKEPSIEDYAPRKQLEPAMQIKSFGDLPTKELDEIISAAEAEIAALKLDAQAIRDTYVKNTNRIIADIKRLQEGVRMSMETMKQLREQCRQLNEEGEPAKKLEPGEQAIAEEFGFEDPQLPNKVPEFINKKIER